MQQYVCRLRLHTLSLPTLWLRLLNCQCQAFLDISVSTLIDASPSLPGYGTLCARVQHIITVTLLYTLANGLSSSQTIFFTSLSKILHINPQLHQLPARLQNICTRHIEEVKNSKENYDKQIRQNLQCLIWNGYIKKEAPLRHSLILRVYGIQTKCSDEQPVPYTCSVQQGFVQLRLFSLCC